ncbi:putative AAA ATPase [Skeletonema marinoi]|uniref:AAA ATPase n=1 Tax=Skeletonema marinoi TaxID=267567 RepID=A0AAD8XUD5_9STRA|nr:putative AAA ATPase [Skeletonema marinoi]
MSVAPAVVGDMIIPLRSWMDIEAKKTPLMDPKSSPNHKKSCSKESIIRKATVAYGIVELLIRPDTNNNNVEALDEDVVQIDNFAVHVSKKSSRQRHQLWDDIKGVSMIYPELALSIEEPAYLSCLMAPEEKQGQLGRYLEVEEMMTSEVPPPENSPVRTAAVAAAESDEEEMLYELFVNEIFPEDCSLAEKVTTVAATAAATEEPAHKRAKSSHPLSPCAKGKGMFDKAELPFQRPSIVRMQQLGIPASLCLMTDNLLESALRGDNGQSSDDAYKSLRDVAEDLHLLLLDPDRFLFDNEVQSTENMKLRYRKEKLYGRDKEETLITDAFCRVSRGKSEAFFIGGFSGCGKSMLVNTLRARVNAVGGYVIKHKFDSLSQERSLSGVISAVNQLCLVLKDRNTPPKIALLANKLRDEFGADIGLLARIVKNVKVLSPEFVSPAAAEEAGGGDKMNARSVGFTLSRFMRLVSSPKHPVMWADDTALDVIHTFLSDKIGSCMFFVGSYRDNEVHADHAVFDLMKKLESSNVPTNKVSLTGLDREDLNTMISDALCLYPRICKSLSEVVMQKTKGNPFFVLEFIKSLKDRDLLKYNFHQKRWVWDEGTIRAEDITDNVLQLLSSEMNGLSDNVQLLLKVMACFGTKTSESVIGYLVDSAEYSVVEDGLKKAVSDGFIERNIEGTFNFVHDKVREAAYNLIPESDRKQFHYNLGRVLHSVCEGKDVGDTILLIATQINHGKEFILKDNELCLPIAKLNMAAGKMAIDSCRHKTAYAYLEVASSLLPNDHWESNYDISLRLSFMMASAANSSCKYDDAEIILQRILKEARCTKDKLPSYFVLSQLFQAQGKVVDAYGTCSSILTQLGETIPDSVDPEVVRAMISETLRKYDEVYCDDWLGKKMEDYTLRYVIRFYGQMATSAYFFKVSHIVAYFVCKGAQLSLENGVCQHTPLVFLQLSSIIMRSGNNIACAHRIAKDAMALSERFNLSDQMALSLNFINAVGHLEWFHAGVQRLRVCFDSALSSGNAEIGFFCAVQLVNYSIISGEKELTSLLKDIDYYLHLLETYKSEVSKNYLLNSRETVSMLIDKGEATSIEAKENLGDVTDPGNIILDTFYCHQVLRNFWLGYGERCRHFAKKGFARIPQGRYFFHIIKFYYGLSLLEMLKKKLNSARQKEVEEIIESMKVAVKHADSNIRNKLELLQAELHGLGARHNEAVALYNAAIASAKKSKFIHEQGLACERAGLYYKKMGCTRDALVHFQQAHACYKEWGSSVKVGAIQRELDGFNSIGTNFI